MAEAKNVLFIMCDQLRWDHLGCYGHPWLKTPNIDALAARGVRFERAFVNSGVCGPSRMSYYTGRYPSSHGATWNRVPLPVDEVTLGEYLRGAGRKLALAGKTHVMVDEGNLSRLQIGGDSELGVLLARGGFEEIDRYDGHHPPGKESGYAAYLRRHGYDSADPWTDYVISGVDAQGKVVSGWHMRNVYLPARVRAEHSETAYMTDQALGFMRQMGDEPWVLHLSYVKPHWPYMAPAPYHALYTPEQCLPVVRSDSELIDQHPVVAAYRQSEESRSFQMDECIRTVRPAYQGLIHQLDDELGRLFEYMEKRGLFDNTLVLFTADHGDYLGDHWLGEKELFHDTVQRVPFIVCDPHTAAAATRGTVESGFIESIDVVPTILDALGIEMAAHRIEGTSLLPLLRGTQDARREVEVASGATHAAGATPQAPGQGTRSATGHATGQAVSPARKTAVFSELDYSFKEARLRLGRTVDQCYAWSLRSERWRYVWWLDAPEQLFDLQADPDEFQDLGRDVSTTAVRCQLRDQLFDWLARRKRRTSVSNAFVESRTNRHKQAGVFFGQW